MITRRRALAGLSAAAVAALGGVVWTRQTRIDLSNLSSRQILRYPDVIDTKSTGRFSLTAIPGVTRFIGGVASPTIGYNQAYLGPIIRLQSGSVKAQIENKLQTPMSVHWHGLLVPGHVDGGPHLAISSGDVWSPEIVVNQKPATAWYHTHIHGRTATDVYAGLAGGLIVSDGRDNDRGLPSEYGLDDLYLVIQDKTFANGRMVYDMDIMTRMHGFTGDTMVINGQVGTVATVPKGVVRLRLLNGSNARIYRLAFNDERPMHLIATDGGYLPAPVALTQLRLAPGERAEVLVDFANGLPVALTSLGDPNSGMAGMMGRFQSIWSSMVGRPFEVMTFAVDERKKPSFTKIASKIGGTLPTLTNRTIGATRLFSLDIGMGSGMMGGGMMGASMGINGSAFNMDRLDLSLKRGTIEKWRVTSSMLAHPFHIHGVLFQILSENGGPPRPENRGWKDTVLINRDVELLVHFDRPAAVGTPFMYHCHILEHEDAGMMGQFAVT